MPMPMSIPFTLLAVCLLAAPRPGLAGDDASARSAVLFPVSTHSDFPSARSAFDEIRELILREYYTDTIDEASLYYAAVRGMLSLISPPRDRDLAAIWSPQDYDRFRHSLRGVRASIGISSHFDPDDGSLSVTGVAPGSPAAGRLRRHDRIVRIDGRALRDLEVEEVDSLLSGETGTAVRLTVVRDIEVLRIEVTRRVFEVEPLEVHLLAEGIAYVRITRITENLSKRVRQGLLPLVARGVDKAILDLRQNTGGVFAEGLRLAELFLPRNSVLLRTVRRGEGLKTYVSSNDSPLSLELLVLVDEQTASASEIAAAALKSHGLARLLGAPTFGKATMEETFTLSNGYAVKFIVGTVYEPRGQSWDGRGIKPDVEVAIAAELRRELEHASVEDRLSHDPQLRAAWNMLR